jgi:hypothetical protein
VVNADIVEQNLNVAFIWHSPESESLESGLDGLRQKDDGGWRDGDDHLGVQGEMSARKILAPGPIPPGDEET